MDDAGAAALDAATDGAGFRDAMSARDGGACDGRGAAAYLAFLSRGVCADVPARRGTWVARSRFPEAPPAVRDQACSYRFRADEGHAGEVAAKAALDALEALSADLLTADCTADPVQPLEERDWRAELGRATELAGEVAGGAGGVDVPTGVSGCDVCARVVGRMLYVILPADQLELRRVAVAVDGGAVLGFELAPPSARAQAYAVELPLPTFGTAYVEGPVRLAR